MNFYWTYHLWLHVGHIRVVLLHLCINVALVLALYHLFDTWNFSTSFTGVGIVDHLRARTIFVSVEKWAEGGRHLLTAVDGKWHANSANWTLVGHRLLGATVNYLDEDRAWDRCTGWARQRWPHFDGRLE